MGVDYQYDIGKLKGIIIILCISYIIILKFVTIDAKLSGSTFVSLDKDSLEHYGLSTEFKTPLMKIIEEVVCIPCAMSISQFHLNVIYTVENVPTIS